MKIGIIGLGNSLRGDDGIGIVLLHRLQTQKKPAWRTYEFLDAGTLGMSLVHDLARYTQALIIDAVDFHGKPGQHRLFSATELLNSIPPPAFSTHEPGLAEVLRLAAELHTLPGHVGIFGVQPATMTYSTELSTEVMAQVDALTGILSSLLDRFPRPQ